MYINSPIKIGTASSLSVNAAQLGQLVLLDGKFYRVVKSTAAIAAAAGLTLTTGYTAGVPNWSVGIPTAATTDDIAGVVPSTQTDSAGATGLKANDYFLIQCHGAATALYANTTLVKTAAQFLQVGTTGYLAAYTGTVQTGANIVATNSAVVTAAAQAGKIFIGGLL